MSKVTKLRQYQMKDIDWLVECMEKYLPELPHFQHTNFNPELARATMQFNCGVDQQFVGFVICDLEHDIPVGGIAVTITRGYASNDLFMWDIFFFILPEWRTLVNAEKLYKAAIDWAKAKGVRGPNIRATVTSGYEAARVHKLMKYLGMEPIGVVYRVKE